MKTRWLAFFLAASLGGFAHASQQVEPEFGLAAPSGLQLGAEQSGDHWLHRLIKEEETRPYLQAGWFSWGFGQAGAGTATTLTVTGAEFGARWYLLKNRLDSAFAQSFYIGTGLGYRLLRVSLAFTDFSLGEGADLERGDLSFHTVHLPVHLGWTWYRGKSLTLSSDLGVQVPVMGWADINVVGNLSNSEVDADPLARVARFALPTVTLLRATWHIGGVGRELASEAEDSQDPQSSKED
jgi:hypothetical protein